MDNPLEIASRVSVGEDDLREFPPIERARLVEDDGSKASDDGIESRCARCDAFTRERISVDRRYAKPLELRPDVTLAGRDAAREGDASHGRILVARGSHHPLPTTHYPLPTTHPSWFRQFGH